jgi:membrane-associated protease RseP (regulator of RpoE activity)/BMFP domain-containing protein YqiC
MFFRVILTVSLMVSVTSVSAQGFLKRLQDRVQSLEQQNANQQDANATGPARGAPQAGDPGSGARRPLVDALLQYGPGILGGANGDNQSLNGSANSASAGSISTPAVSAAGKASLGIDVLDSPPGIPGVLVTGFRKDSQADDAGLQKDDVIVSLDQTLTPKIADVARLLSQRRPGQVVTARVLRGDRMKTIQIPLLGPPLAGTSGPLQAGNVANSSRQPSVPVAPVPKPPSPGLGQSAGELVPVPSTNAPETLPGSPFLESLPAPVAQRNSAGAMIEQYGIIPRAQSKLRGAVVEGVVQGSTAAVAGILPADRVVSVDGLLTRDAQALSRQLASLPERSSASLGVVRDNAYFIKPMLLTTEIRPASNSVGGGQAGAASAAQDSATKPVGGENGVLEGIGSVLGGLLGGTQKKSEGSPSTGSPSAGTGGSKTGPNSKPVRQTSFEQKVSGQLQKILGDPPSLSGLPVTPKSKTDNIPSDEAPSRETGQTAAEMREQIRQLQEKVKQMEAESTMKEKAAAEDTSSDAGPK